MTATTRYHTLQEIAEMLEQELLKTEDFKEYTSWICNETYPDVEQHEQEADAIEREWPTFKDDRQLGRVPEFVWEDKNEPHLYTDGISVDELRRSASNYAKKFHKARQHTMSRVQHHHHKKDKKTGLRRPLPACRAQKKDECKHGFPKTKLLTEHALVVCPGIAQQRGLRVSGRRNALGSILPRRNCVWVNGTAPAFAVAFGFNTDVSPNDRLPVTKGTHEASCTRSSCVKDCSKGEVARAESRAQLDTDGYFGGYINKAQPVGSFELRKCMQNMRTLNERIGVEYTQADQMRTVSRRMIVDLELRGVLRGGPEVFNLCVHMKEEDSLFAECIYTFMTVSFPSGDFVNKLEAEWQGVGSEISRRIPKSKGPRSSRRSDTAPRVDGYGFRGQNPLVLYLSPFEFFMYWDIKSVPEPFRRNCDGRSVWTEEGREYYENHKHEYGLKLIPGKHYKVGQQQTMWKQQQNQPHQKECFNRRNGFFSI